MRPSGTSSKCNWLATDSFLSAEIQTSLPGSQGDCRKAPALCPAAARPAEAGDVYRSQMGNSVPADSPSAGPAAGHLLMHSCPSFQGPIRMYFNYDWFIGLNRTSPTHRTGMGTQHGDALHFLPKLPLRGHHQRPPAAPPDLGAHKQWGKK